MTNSNSAGAAPAMDRVETLMSEEYIAAFVAKNENVKGRVRHAANWLVRERGDKTDEELVMALRRVLSALRDQELRVFLSYKAKDASLANQIARKLESWSAKKLMIDYMADLSVEEVGRRWRANIEKTIPQCDWFLLLLPDPGEERDWVLFEAGYFFRGQGLVGRLVCLHHPDNRLADAIQTLQSVPAETGKVQDFLKGLFHEPDWIPGMPAINDSLEDLEGKAKEIVDLIKPPVGNASRSWTDPHMEVAFENAAAVSGWGQLAAGRVIDSNPDCLRLFNLEVSRHLLGDWLASVAGAGQDAGWVKELACAVQAVGSGNRVPCLNAVIHAGDGSCVRPQICSVTRRGSDPPKVESIDILFSKQELPPTTTTMNADLAVLSITLEFAVRFRYQILERFARRELDGKDVLAFNRAVMELQREVVHDRRFSEDPSVIQEQTLALFAGDDRAVIQKMWERSDQLWRPDGGGEMDLAVADLDGEALARFVKELLEMNQSFLSVTSRRFAELIASR